MPHHRIRPSQPIGPTHRIPHSGLNAPRCRRRLASYSATNVDQPHKNPMPTRNCRKGQYETSVPTIADRVAQTVVARRLEAKVEPIFHPDSYGYRPYRSALDAVAVCRERCWKSDWVIDLDIQKFLDASSHCGFR
jgi:hypothetical protein